MLVIAALTFHLVIMPTSGSSDRELMKPFDTDKYFPTEADCKADAAANMQTYLQQRGFSPGATANFACTVN